MVSTVNSIHSTLLDYTIGQISYIVPAITEALTNNATDTVLNVYLCIVLYS